MLIDNLNTGNIFGTKKIHYPNAVKVKINPSDAALNEIYESDSDIQKLLYINDQVGDFLKDNFVSKINTEDLLQLYSEELYAKTLQSLISESNITKKDINQESVLKTID
jgi:hypothetical protein